MEQFRVAIAAAVTLQRRARGRSGRRIGLYRAALRESVAVGIRRMEAIAEAMSAASDAAAAARRASELAAAAAKKAFTECALFTAAMVVQDRRRDAAAQRMQRAGAALGGSATGRRGSDNRCFREVGGTTARGSKTETLPARRSRRTSSPCSRAGARRLARAKQGEGGIRAYEAGPGVRRTESSASAVGNCETEIYMSQLRPRRAERKLLQGLWL